MVGRLPETSATRTEDMPTRAPRAHLAVALLLLGALSLTACGTGSLASVGSSTPDDRAVAAPRLGDVEALADPRTWQGGSTASLGEAPLRPVAEDPRPDLPVTVTDAQGTEVRVEDADRILALDLSGSLAQIVFELGLGGRVVGRDVSTGFPEAADLPLVTHNGHELNAERMLDLAPSVILTDTSLGPWSVMEQMRDAGIPVVVLDSHRGLDNLRELITTVADALGVSEEGRALARRTQREVTAVRAEIDAVAPRAMTERLRTVFLYVRGQSGVYYLFGDGSGADALIDALGLYDVSTEIGWKGMRPVTDEAIVAAQPELILMMTKGLESVGGTEGLLERLPALANTPAGVNGRIVDMADSQILGFGPRTAEVLNALAVAVYAPEAVGAAS